MKNKKAIRIFNLLLSALLVVSLFSTNVNFVEASQADKVMASLGVNNLISYKEDVEGNLNGPEDFTVDNNDIYLLDSTDNKVIKFNNGKVVDTIKLNDKALKIASKNKNLYALNIDLTITKYDANGNASSIELDRNKIDEAVVDFQVIDTNLYVATTEGNSGMTYKINEAGELVDSFEGRIFDENTLYRNELIPEKGKSVGHSCKLTVTDLKTGTEKVLNLTSKHWLIGAQYLGTDEKGNYRIKMFEMMTQNDNTVLVEETVRIVKPNGVLTGIREKAKQKKSVPNQIKVYKNEVYELNNLENTVEIIKVAAPKSDSVQKFKSKLDNMVEPMEIAQEPSYRITRATIMSNAKAYHSAFTWSCTSANLAAMTNYTKPRYVGSAGSYTYMPYCWGGFSSPTQYKTGLSNGGRVGNIYTGTGAYVSNTYGVDCSGYVSRAWGLTTKYGTSTIMNVAFYINASSLLQGDALNYSGSHIVLFEKFDANGNYTVYEATTWNSYDRVAHTVRTVSSMTNYKPIRYNSIT